MPSFVSKVLVGAIGAAAIALPLVAAAPASAAPEWTDLPAGDQPAANPLKGFIPFRGEFDTFPHSMEWSYFPVNAVMNKPGTFDWSTIDAALDDVKARGHQTAMRFYLDLPGQPSGVPDYLLDNDLVETRSYDDYGNNGISVSPDYDDPDLVAAMTTFIDALGERYDGDPRLGYLTLGLIGFWGEWHTYPYNGDGQPNWMANEDTQLSVLNAFVDSFEETPLEVRYPSTLNKDLPIGYHDDSFAYSTKQSNRGWHFMDEMLRVGTQDKWQEYSIGGELRPELQLCIFTPTGCQGADRPDPEGDYDFPGSVAQTHATWMMNHRAFTPGYDEVTQANAIAASQSLGYAFRATRAAVSATDPRQTTVAVEIANDGVAPFYRKWPIELAAIDADGDIVWSEATDWLVRSIPSMESRQFETTVDLSGLPDGDYSVILQIPNPMEGGMPVRFGNEAQDLDVDGWLTIGSAAIEAEGAVTPTPTPTPSPSTAPTAAPTPTSGPTPAPAPSAVSPVPTDGDGSSMPPTPTGVSGGASSSPELAETGSTSGPAVALATGGGLLLVGVGTAAVAMGIRSRRSTRSH